MIHVSIGSNLQPHVHVPRAIDALQAQFGALRVSACYETPPIGRPEQPSYWNGVAALQSDLPRGSIEARLRHIEEAEGRIRTSDSFAARTLDLDIIGWNGAFDAEVAERPFLARCLADLGDLPADVPVPAATWPVARQAQP